MIPEAAVEAAARAYASDICYEPEPCDSCIRRATATTRAALEAAAPHMLAGVVALHYPRGDSYKTCAHCIRPSGYPNRPEQPAQWPCPTAVAAGLAEDESGSGNE